MHRLLWKDVRLLGALTALGLDLLWLVFSVVLVVRGVALLTQPVD